MGWKNYETQSDEAWEEARAKANEMLKNFTVEPYNETLLRIEKIQQGLEDQKGDVAKITFQGRSVEEKIRSLQDGYALHRYTRDMNDIRSPERAAVKMAVILLQTNGYVVRGYKGSDDRLIVTKEGEYEGHLFLPKWLLPKIKYDTLLVFIEAFIEDNTIFEVEDTEYSN